MAVTSLSNAPLPLLSTTFELAYRSIKDSSVPEAPPQEQVVRLLLDALKLPSGEFNKVVEKVNKLTPEENALERLHELEDRLNLVIGDSHPYIKKDSFATPAEYASWKEAEKTAIVTTMKTILGKFGQVGKLQIKVIEARGLKTPLGKFAPFFTVTVGEHSSKTGSAAKQENPYWNEEFSFDISACPNTINLKLFANEGKEAKDNLIGETEIHFTLEDMLSEKKITSEWFKVVSAKNHVKGEVLLDVSFVSKYHKFHEVTVNPASAKKSSERPSYYQAFDLLAMALVMFDKQDSSTGSGSNIRSSVPSAEGKWLLTSFSASYGIGTLYHKLKVLSLLSKEYEPKLGIFTSITELYSEISSNTTDKFTTAEADQYHKVVAALTTSIESTISSYKETFPKNKPQGALAGVIETFSNLTKKQFTPKLIACITKGNEDRYAKMMTSPVTVQSLCTLLDAIYHQIDDDYSFFLKSFPPTINFVKETTVSYLSLFIKDVSAFCDKDGGQSADWADLYFKIKQFGERVAPLMRKEPLPPVHMTEMFSSFVFNWLKDRLQKLSAAGVDLWKNDKKGVVSEEQPHSSSVEDLFNLFKKDLAFLESLDMNFPFFFAQLIEIFCAGTHEYMMALHADILEMFKPTINKINTEGGYLWNLFQATEQKPAEPEEPYTLSPLFCIIANNMEVSCTRLDELAQAIEKDVVKCFTSKYPQPPNQENEPQPAPQLNEADAQQVECIKESIYKSVRYATEELKKNVSTMFSMAQVEVNKFMRLQLVTAATTAPDIRTVWDPLAAFLDQQFKLISRWLYPALFRKMLRSIWELFIMDVRELLLVPKSRHEIGSIHQAEIFSDLFERLCEYFTADGQGLTQATIDEETAFIVQIIDLYKTQTPNLVKLAISLEGERKYNMGGDKLSYSHVMKILGARKDDREAFNFVKERDEAHHAPATMLGKLDIISLIGSLDELNQPALRQYFGLDASEVILERFNATCRNYAGFLYVTSSYVCYDTSFGFGGLKTIIPIADIAYLTKEKTMFIVDTALKITKVNGQSYSFAGFLNRNKAYQCILDQAKKLGNTHIVAN